LLLLEIFLCKNHIHTPNSRITIAPREMPTPSPIFAPVERPPTAAAEAEVDGEATLVLDGMVEASEDRKILAGACDVKETVAVVAASRIDRSELARGKLSLGEASYYCYTWHTSA
jgi:hypothetical protein